MKKLIINICCAILIVGILARPATAAFPLFGLIRAAAIKAIKAADLAIQRQQNKVIWLQNAQKTIENAMSKLKLGEISEWTDKQREQYQQYFDELWRVKAMISYYKRIAEMAQRQIQLVKEFERTWALLKADRHFTVAEIEYMSRVYAGILRETIKNIDQLLLVVNSFKTQMGDAQRLELINDAADRVEENYSDLRAFNNENVRLSLTRAASEADRENIKRFYGMR
ncbi:conjugal transfer protein TraI [Pedobacter chitinilyticus]|uniref:Conjugal transfer protein TraI n=1 Tax=Pedobacter chitinilyticus TaxID=2233776 RepID=A0A3S3QG12_9SPHI|nr:conjugal transfer protein TraI [Pedobacter chitinilyticus]RWU08132.1 conjugal transfer protein TraI [Pedobacter chitinilyticus]